jgi:crotonobetainyl-CoA:carnitine CoA-transferase CaiB-like acyl-CoA transferase
VGSDGQFDSLLQLCGLEELRQKGDFRTNKERVKRRDELYQLLKPCFLNNSREYWMNTLLDKGIPAGSLFKLDEVLGSEQAKALVFRTTNQTNEFLSLRTSPLSFE